MSITVSNICYSCSYQWQMIILHIQLQSYCFISVKLNLIIRLIGAVTRVSITIVSFIRLIITVSPQLHQLVHGMPSSKHPQIRVVQPFVRSHFFTSIRYGGAGTLFIGIGSRRSSEILHSHAFGSKELPCQSWIWI